MYLKLRVIYIIRQKRIGVPDSKRSFSVFSDYSWHLITLISLNQIDMMDINIGISTFSVASKLGAAPHVSNIGERFK